MASVRRIRRQDLQLVENIGEGGYSSVYKALWKKMEVAAKKLNKVDYHELDIISELQHPNIVKLIGMIDENFEVMLVMELHSGGSLRSYLNKSQDHLPIEQFFDWAKQAALPIQYLTQMKIVHKDIKSPNYLIADGDILKLADFGLAKKIGCTINNATHTATFSWMAPELMTKSKLSPSYDIYAYAVVLWELWTRMVPFAGVELANIIWKICHDNERPEIPRDCPKPIADLMRECWQVKWHRRPSIEHVLTVLDSTRQAILGHSSTGQQLQKGQPSLEQSLGSVESKEPQMTRFQSAANGQHQELVQIVSTQNYQENERLSVSVSAEQYAKQKTLQVGPWEFVYKFGHDGPDRLRDATGISANNIMDVIAIADVNAAEVKVFGAGESGEYQFSLDMTEGLTPGRVSRPCGVLISPEGKFYVTDQNPYVKVYNAIGDYMDRWVAISPAHVPSDTENTMLWGLAMNARGQLLFGEVRKKYISIHKPDGEHIHSIKVGICPSSLATTSLDTIIVSDQHDETVQIVDNAGYVLQTLGPSVDVVSDWMPCGVCCMKDIIYVCNQSSPKYGICCFSVSGEYLGSIAVDEWPNRLTFVDDKVFVTHGAGVICYRPSNPSPSSSI